MHVLTFEYRTTTVLPDPSTPAPTLSLSNTCKSSLVDLSMQILKFQRRSCKLSFLFPPRRQGPPESLLAGYCTSLVLNHFCSVTIPFYTNPSPKYLQVTCKKIYLYFKFLIFGYIYIRDNKVLFVCYKLMYSSNEKQKNTVLSCE